jgi:hypothetical protein
MGAWGHMREETWARQRLSGGGRWGQGRRDKVRCTPQQLLSFSSMWMDTCRLRDPEAAILVNLRRKIIIFHAKIWKSKKVVKIVSAHNKMTLAIFFRSRELPAFLTFRFYYI